MSLTVRNVRKILPLRPPKKWNVFEVTSSGRHRTNNHCESWNNSFKSLVMCNQPSISVPFNLSIKIHSTMKIHI